MSSVAAAGPLSDAGAAAEANVPATADIPAAAPRCDNCGAAIAGRYCAACGQRREPPLHSLWRPWQRQIQPAARAAGVHMLADNFRSLREAFLHNLPRAMFLFLPMLAAAIMLLYWGPRHYYIEHLLLLVHNHAFVFLVVMLAAAVSALLPAVTGLLRVAVTLYIAWYAYRSLRVVYGQGSWLTAGKLALLSLFYLVSGGLMLLLTFVSSALTL
jgi:hypothetical protein